MDKDKVVMFLLALSVLFLTYKYKEEKEYSYVLEEALMGLSIDDAISKMESEANGTGRKVSNTTKRQSW